MGQSKLHGKVVTVVENLKIGKLYVLSQKCSPRYATSVGSTNDTPLVEIEHGVPFVLLGIDYEHLPTCKIILLYKNNIIFLWDDQDFMEKIY